MKKLWRIITGYFPSTCECCGKIMLNRNKVTMASISCVGVYYKGSGACKPCVDKKMCEALEET